MKKKSMGYKQLLYLYTRSFYRDIPVERVALEAHKTYMERLKQVWPGYSEYEKGLAATTLFRYGFKEDALKVLRSLKEYATVSRQGMFWANNTSSVFYINSSILTHTTIMEAFHEITPEDADLNRMKTWLLNQKQTQDWQDVPSTVNAIYALLLTGNDLLSQ